MAKIDYDNLTKQIVEICRWCRKYQNNYTLRNTFKAIFE